MTTPAPVPDPPAPVPPAGVPDDRLPPGALHPVRPAYGSGSLADLLPAVLAVLGVPGARDVLGLRDRLAGVRRVAVLLVDGLGAYQLPVLAPHAPAVAALAAGAGTLTSGFPSTTPVSLVTLGTGAPPGAHGVLGFTVRRPDGGVLNHIRWSDDPDPRRWQPLPTRFAAAAAAGVRTVVAAHPDFAGSGLSVAAYDGAHRAAASDDGAHWTRDAAGALAEAMLAGLREPGPALVYGYHPDLDHHGHAGGVDSPAWRDAARGVDRLVARLLDGLPPDGALLVTADHGQLNVPADARVDLAAAPELAAGLATVAGEPRVRYLHPVPGARDDVLAAWRQVLGDAADVRTREEAVAAGWYGPVPAAHAGRLGDVVVTCRGRAAVLATGWEPARLAAMVAFHGAATAAETTVPLLVHR